MKTFLALALLALFTLEAHANATYEDLVLLFEAGQSKVDLGPLSSTISFQECNQFTGCGQEQIITQYPKGTYKNESLWQCGRCSSTRYLYEGQKEISLPLAAFTARLETTSNSRTPFVLKLSFGNSFEEQRGQFNSFYNVGQNKFFDAGYSLYAFTKKHPRSQCSNVGRDEECKYGNYFSNGKLFFQSLVFEKSSKVSINKTGEVIIEFAAKSKMDRNGNYQQGKLILSTP